MCGIIGYIGKKKCLPIIINGLESLEYRGYDSAGVAYIKNDKIEIIKEKGKIKNLKEKINLEEDTYIGIGHTRWATHGEANQINAHPHSVNDITIVHNGIIENYIELKKELKSKGYFFISETDTEVAAAYIDYLYKKEGNILKALTKLEKIFKGAYALGILLNGDDNLYAIRKTSPLIVAKSKDGNFIASDVPAILNYTNKYILIDDNEIVKLTKDNVVIYKNLKERKKEEKVFEGTFESATKAGYPHFMLKEINEQDQVFKDTINCYFDGSFTSLENSFGFLNNFHKFDIVACGSAYHTGVVGKYLIEKFANTSVNVEVASEYRYKKNFYDKDTLVILVSQSGETADTLATLRKAKEDGIKTLAIVNVLGSSIAREADYVIYIKAGFEIAVATTKAYLAQLAIFSLITLYLGWNKHLLTEKDIEKITKDINDIPRLIKNTIEDQKYLDIAKKIYKHKQIFFIGRGIDYAISLEASLKLKEISYINSVAYQAGELKHGTISLVEEGTPVVAISTDKDLMEKMISNIKEVKSRGSYVVLVSNINPSDDFFDDLIKVTNIHPILQEILTIIPLQLLAYQMAKNNNCDIDKPRNLAKSVTVE